jgi:hypothetical protein
VLASLTAVVVVPVSARASVFTALQRTVAVVLGVLAALALGGVLPLNALTVALLVTVSLGVAELGLRLPRAAARQVPVSLLVVLSAVAATPGEGWRRALDTLIGGAVGVAVSLALPASRLRDARHTLDRLGTTLADLLESIGAGLREPSSVAATEEWRRTARVARQRLVVQAADAVGNSREAARWNVRDRRHITELARYEEMLPRLERTAIGVSVITRGLDDHARLGAGEHRAMPALGALFEALGVVLRARMHDLLTGIDGDVGPHLDELRRRRDRCAAGAARRAHLALEPHEGSDADSLEAEWLGYAALLVQVDRVVADLQSPPPA